MPKFFNNVKFNFNIFITELNLIFLTLLILLTFISISCFLLKMIITYYLSLNISNKYLRLLKIENLALEL